MGISTARPEAGLDRFVPAPLREAIEQRYWRPIERATTAERLIDDPDFLVEPDRHPVLFSDHGVVHVRDVARGAVALADATNGVLLSRRDDDRLFAVQQLAVMLVHLHDIGMVEPTRARRRVHPQWAAQLAWSDEFADLLHGLAALEPLADTLDEVAAELGDGIDRSTRCAEVLSLTMCHSKSLVPAELLADPASLGQLLRHAVFTDLDDQVHRGWSATEPSWLAGRHDRGRSFTWLVTDRPACRRLSDDVLDACRVTRAADALRQRGTVQRTSAGYEVFLDSETGQALFAIRPDDTRPVTYLGLHSPISAGEAAIRETAITAAGDLRIMFHAERFADHAADITAEYVAKVVADVADDALPAFVDATSGPGLGPRAADGATAMIELVGHEGGREFAERVAARMADHRPDLASKLRAGDAVLPDPPIDTDELDRLNAGRRLDADRRVDVLEQLVSVPGIRGDLADDDLADVREIDLLAGDVLVRAGCAAAVAYVPTGPGLVVEPLGGYATVEAPPWELLGLTGVMRSGERNADVRATSPVTVLAVPADVFRRRWFRPLDASDLVDTLRADRRVEVPT